jgi:hypothetical protein
MSEHTKGKGQSRGGRWDSLGSAVCAAAKRLSTSLYRPCAASHVSSRSAAVAPIPALSFFFDDLMYCVEPASSLPRPTQRQGRDRPECQRNARGNLRGRGETTFALHPTHLAHHAQAEVVLLFGPETVTMTSGTAFLTIAHLRTERAQAKRRVSALGFEKRCCSSDWTSTGPHGWTAARRRRGSAISVFGAKLEFYSLHGQ